MSKYELAIKTAQIQKLVEERKYRKAAAVLETIDVNQVRSRADLHTFAEVYMKTEQFEAAKAIYLKLYKRNHTRRILHRLIFLSIRTGKLDEAELFYDEFVSMSNSSRDNLILRYRLDKAEGAPVGQLIQLLEQLKSEEYTEEWAYELAKLYLQAGMKEECRQECEDIALWFGQGEIVERAKMLIDYIDDDSALPYFDDRDYTVKQKEKPNMEDTGSLPEIDPELLKEKSAFHKLTSFLHKNKPDGKETVMPQKESSKESGKKSQEEQKAEEDIENQSDQKTEQPEQENHSQSGMGITKDLAKEISAIFEAERREQLKEKAVNVLGETSNVAVNVVDRMAQAMQKKAEKNYFPLDVSDDTSEELTASDPAVATAQADVPEADVKETDSDTEIEAENIIVAESRTAPDGMEEIREAAHTEPTHSGEVPEAGAGEKEVTMIDLDKIMPEPDIPERRQVIPQDSPEVDKETKLDERDLPTTRALHRTFDNMLTLIAGEREPKHFVLVGNGEERILGVTKKIVRLMNKKQFLSTTKIARIQAEQLNQLDLFGVAYQIKGGCLLIDGASALLFPTITKIFTLMDEFQGDFMVVLADEGNILDELFRVAPALARRFEYVIDISKYTEADYAD